MAAGSTQAFYLALYGRKVENPLTKAARFEELRSTCTKTATLTAGRPAGVTGALRDEVAALTSLARKLQDQLRRAGYVADRAQLDQLEAGLREVHGKIAARFQARLPAGASDERRRAHYEVHVMADAYNRLVGVADRLRVAADGEGAAFLDAERRIFPTERFRSRAQLLGRLQELHALPRRALSGESSPEEVATTARALATDYRVRLGNLGGPGENATRPFDQAMRRYFNRIVEDFQTATVQGPGGLGVPLLSTWDEAAFERLKFHSEGSTATAA